MKGPTLKHALLCKIIVYSVIIVPIFALIFVIPCLSFIPEIIRVLFALAVCIVAIIYISKRFVLLVTMSMILDIIQCHNTARKQFVLPDSFSVKSVEDKISKFGQECNPTFVLPAPEKFLYKRCCSLDGFTSHIEKFALIYYVDLLNKEEYRRIVKSAENNTKDFKKKDPHTKATYSNVTVIFIFAKRVSEDFNKDLFDTVCNTGPKEIDVCTLPCVVDFEKGSCCFNSERLPYFGMQYPARNRGIKFIKKYLFDNRFTFNESFDVLEPIEDINAEQSLWNFWKETEKELIQDEIKTKKQFKKMNHKDILFEEYELFIKWEERGVSLSVEIDDEQKTAEIILSDLWDYPKSNKISKEALKGIKELSQDYFMNLGYSVRFV